MRSLFKTSDIQLLGIAKKKRSLSPSLQTLWEILIYQIYQVENLLKESFKNIQKFQILFGINFPKFLTSLNIPKYSRMRSVVSN